MADDFRVRINTGMGIPPITLLDDKHLRNIQNSVIPGPPGPQGPPGVDGMTGPTGNQGNTGPTGLQGNVGPTGNQGNVGPTGNQGNVGSTGNQGNVGPTGNQGSIGPTGNQGNVGPTGNQGGIGPTGNQGNTGPIGTSGIISITYIRDEKSVGTNGGTFNSGVWQTRTLNTITGDLTYVSLSSNQFTIQPGTYTIKISTPAYRVRKHKCRLQNITDGTTDSVGTSEYEKEKGQSRSLIWDDLIVSSPKIYEVQHMCSSTQVNTGYGLQSGFVGYNEIYTIVAIFKRT